MKNERNTKNLFIFMIDQPPNFEILTQNGEEKTC